MPTVPLSQLKPGDRLIEDVVTRLGSTLYPKGKLLYQKDMEILHAFLIPNVVIETRVGLEMESEKESNDDQPMGGLMQLYREYDKTVQILKKIFMVAGNGENIPILDVRNALESLIAQLPHYSVLSFIPRNFAAGDYIFHNSVQVAMTSYQLAKWHGYSTKDLIPIAMSGLLHDIGNTKIDSSLLSKPGKLTPQELEEVRRHTVYGYQLLKNVAAINEGVKLSTLQHHERLDGSGYPLGLTGDKIHPYARIIAVADIYHAMTSARLHRKAESAYLVLEQLYKESFGKLDPSLVQTFIQKVTALHNGILVRLSDNQIGEIVFTDRNNPTRPMVNVNGKIINLVTDRSLHIHEIVHR
jgi:HD-GYP domain-containing protein (c-di-GMP phosphodiesterase class II)